MRGNIERAGLAAGMEQPADCVDPAFTAVKQYAAGEIDRRTESTFRSKVPKRMAAIRLPKTT